MAATKKKMPADERGRGRPSLGRDAAPLFLRLTSEERERCEERASRAGLTLAEWARRTLLGGLALLLAACSSHSELGRHAFVEEDAASSSGAAVSYPPPGAGGAPAGVGGASPFHGAGGRVVAGGRPGVGGAMVASGGVSAGAGGDRPATGGCERAA